LAKALSNAERQKRWRDKRNALAKQAQAGLAKGKPATLRNDGLVEQFCANAGALVDGLITEGDKDPATFSPNTVRRLADQLKHQVDALRNGDELPELASVERRHAKIVKQRAGAKRRVEPLLQWTLAPRHASTRRKADKASAAGVSANVGDSNYDISVTTAGYAVSYSPDSRHPQRKRRRLDGLFSTVEEAKAAAERDRRRLKVT